MPNRNATSEEWVLAKSLAVAVKRRYDPPEHLDVTAAFIAGRLVDIAEDAEEEAAGGEDAD